MSESRRTKPLSNGFVRYLLCPESGQPGRHLCSCCSLLTVGTPRRSGKHAEELLALFEEARGRPARTTDELARWLDSVDDDLADDIAREVAEEVGRKAGREAAKKNGREAYEEASDRAYERAYERVLESLRRARRQDHP
jgi:hypothetical protein